MSLTHVYRDALREARQLRRKRHRLLRRIEARHRVRAIDDRQREEAERVVSELIGVRIDQLEAFIRAAGGNPGDPAVEGQRAARGAKLAAVLVGCLIGPLHWQQMVSVVLQHGAAMAIAAAVLTGIGALAVYRWGGRRDV